MICDAIGRPQGLEPIIQVTAIQKEFYLSD